MIERKVKEKFDYEFCLERSRRIFKNKLLLVLEDDALPAPECLKNLEKLIRNLKKLEEDWIYTKVFYPNRWCGFEKTFSSIVELICKIPLNIFSLNFIFISRKPNC